MEWTTFEKQLFASWMRDNVVLWGSFYSTQDAQYQNKIKSLDELKEYYIKEFKTN